MADGRVSVVVPVRDGARYLAEALASVLAQTRPPDEVIVVDDGSVDGSAALAASFGQPVRCVSQAPAGIGAARNHGVRLAGGDVLAFLDADDLWEPVKLERQLAALRAEPALEVVFTHVRQFVSPELDAAAAARLHCPTEPQPGPFASTLLARRSALARCGPFAEDVLVSEMLDWVLRAREAGVRERMLPDVLVRRRLHEGNHWRRNRTETRELARALKHSLDRRRAAAELA